MKSSLFAIAVAMLIAPFSAHAETIGVAAPLSGPSAILGVQIKAGAEAAAAALGVGVEVVDDACSADGGKAAAERFIAADVTSVVGFLCSESIQAALPLLTAANIPTITVGVRTDSLTDSREKTGWIVYRLGPRADSERFAAAALLTQAWRTELFAIIDDGTIYGRELVETFRATAEQAALKPVFIDTFRPQLDNQVGLIGRLRKSGATHIFVGGDREDVAIMARDAAKLGADLTFAAGETLRGTPADRPLEDGTLMVAMPEWASIADKAAIEAIQAHGAIPEGYALPTFAAMELAAQAASDAAVSQKSIADVLSSQTFNTAIGQIQFDQKGNLLQNPYRLFRSENGEFVPVAAQ